MKYLLRLMVLVLSPVPLFAASATLTTNGSACPAGGGSTSTASALVLGLADKGGATLTVGPGTWTGTISFYGTGSGGQVWTALLATPLSSGTRVSSTTSNGTWQVGASGFTAICMLSSAAMTGSVQVTITPGTPSASNSGGSVTPSANLTTNVIPKGTGVSSIGDSSLSDNGTTISSSEALNIGAITAPSFTGTGPSYIVLASNPTYTYVFGSITNNAGVPTWGTGAATSTPICTGAACTLPAGSAIADITNPSTMYVKDEFTGGTSGGTGSVSELGWTTTTIGSAGAISNAIVGVYPHIGIAQLATNSGATQGQGESMNLGPAGSNQSFGDLGTNTNWAETWIFSLQSASDDVFRIGFVSASGSAARPSTWMGLRFDTNIGNGAVNISNNGISCTTTVCTVTTATHGLVLVGQSVTIASATGCARTINATWVIASIPSTTTYTFNSPGGVETCGGNTPATSTPVAGATFKFESKNGSNTASTVVDTGVAADTGWHKLVMTSSVAGTVIMTLDNGSPQTISTNVPTGNMTPEVIMVTDVTAQKTVQLDYFSFKATGLSR